MIVYEGIFFEDEETVRLIHSHERRQLPNLYGPLHVTFKFRPTGEELYDHLVGSEIEVLVIGYGCDGNNSGFAVLLPDDLEEYFINCHEGNPGVKKVPHITASLAPGARAVNTKDLEFEPLPEPFIIRGKFGYFVKGMGVSYEPSKGSKTKKLVPGSNKKD